MRPLISDSFATTIAFFMQRSLGFIRELVLARILGPYYMGLRNTIVMLHNYAPYALLGMQAETYRTVALEHTKSPEKSNQYFSTGLVFTIAVSLILAVLIAMYSYFSLHSIEFKYGLYLLSFIVILRNIGPFITTYYQARGMFKYTSIVEIFVVFVNAVLVLTLAYLFGFLGAVIGLLASVSVRMISHLIRLARLSIPLIFDVKKFRHLFKGGMRLFITSIAGTLYSQVDSLITVLMLGPAALGIYGIAQTINSFIYGIFGATVQPAGQRMFKAANDEKLLKRYMNMLLALSSYAMVFPIALIVFATPFIVNAFIPRFQESIALVNVLAIASFFNVTLNQIGGYVVAKRREHLSAVSAVIAGGINLILDVYLIQQGYGIMGVAYATSFSYFLNYLMLIWLSKAVNLIVAIEDLIPILYLVSLIVAWDLLIGAALTVLYIPIMYYVFKKRGIINYAKSLLSELI